MAYQIAKEIGALATVVCGQVDAILFTGGMAHSAYFTDLIVKRVGFIAKPFFYPGEDEMEALAYGVLRVLGREEAELAY
jgi:butyrate kinase